MGIPLVDERWRSGVARRQSPVATLPVDGRPPFHLQPPPACGAVSQIEIDQTLVRHLQLLRQPLEVGDRRFIQADGDRAFQRFGVRISSRLREVVFLSHLMCVFASDTAPVRPALPGARWQPPLSDPTRNATQRPTPRMYVRCMSVTSVLDGTGMGACGMMQLVRGKALIICTHIGALFRTRGDTCETANPADLVEGGDQRIANERIAAASQP
jgi:hypothetical protein